MSTTTIPEEIGRSLLLELLRQCATSLRADSGCVFRYDSIRKMAVLVACTPSEAEPVAATVPLVHQTIDRLLLARQACTVDGWGFQEERRHGFLDSGPPTSIGAPLIWDNDAVGGVIVTRSWRTGPFDDTDLVLLSTVAKTVATVIGHSRLWVCSADTDQTFGRSATESIQELAEAKEEVAEKAAQLQSLLARTVHAQEEERARIAHDMHDSVIQLIAATRYELQAARMAAEAKSYDGVRSKLSAAREVLDEMEKEIRHAIYHLHPPILDDMGLVPAIQKHVNEHLEPSGVSCRVLVKGIPIPLSAAIESGAFRMVEAAVQNVAIHAQARSVTIILSYGSARLLIAVRDNGAGFTYRPGADRHPRSQLGLAGMRERAESLGGKMDVRSKPGLGTTVIFRLPLSA